MAALPSILSLLFLLAITATAATKHPAMDFRVGLSHVDSDKSLTQMQIINRALSRDRHRIFILQMFQSMFSESKASASDFQARIQADSGDYAMNVSVGNPPVQFAGIIDTGSDLIWTQCTTNLSAHATPTSPRYYNPRKSPTAKNVTCSDNLCKALPKPKCNGAGCEYAYGYGDGSMSEGFMARDVFGFGPGVRAPNVGFGCGVVNKGQGLETGRGVIGLGRGNLSLVTQLGIKKFSYCLSGIGTQSLQSKFAVGAQAGQIGNASVTGNTTKSFSTALINNPSNPTFYYVSLEGISVGAMRLPIPKSTFEIGADGSGGMIVDSGTTLTMISEDAYNMVRAAFVGQTNLTVGSALGRYGYDKINDVDITGLDLCFDLGGKTVEVAQREIPRLGFHFTGMDLDLEVENYMVADLEEKQLCLAMAPAGVLSILGNIQQQNRVMLHDLEKGTLSMIPASCHQL